MSSKQGLAKKTVTSVAVTYLGYLLTKSMVLITTAVLARLLTKGEFGIVGFATTSVSFFGCCARSRDWVGTHPAARRY